MDETRENPRNLKAELAQRIVGLYHGSEAGAAASEEFDRMFREQKAPDKMLEVRLDADDENGLWIVRALAESGLVKSNSDARRMIKQNAVKVDGTRISDEEAKLPKRSEPFQVQVGKRSWARIHVT